MPTLLGKRETFVKLSRPGMEKSENIQCKNIKVSKIRNSRSDLEPTIVAAGEGVLDQLEALGVDGAASGVREGDMAAHEPRLDKLDGGVGGGGGGSS